MQIKALLEVLSRFAYILMGMVQPVCLFVPGEGAEGAGLLKTLSLLRQIDLA